ncbi:MAG TPA: sigma-54 dependent transcriptional regulator [Candidatus Deferrimicrobiaceae bacterium]|nr:sigma-54 dependent transcriptional regulator [Candidatus Deferrimicrobiaceae bacterium]
MKPTILVAEDDRNLRRVLRAMLVREGYDVAEAADGEAASAWLSGRRPDVLITDIRMPKMDGLALFRHARERHPDVPVILITAYGTIGDAVEAIRSGAFDYISKPFDEAELLRVVGNAARTSVVAAREGAGGDGEGGWFGMVGRSPAWREIRKVIEKAAASPLSVMITGETGTGKELVARAIHRISGRGEGPFIKITGAAIPPPLWEAEVFGYEKGAFTGAVLSKPGRFELADGGTFFLDEIGDVPLAMQAKLLRVLQDRAFERVGGVKTLTADVRFICASNRDLKKETERGRFREDLYYRINGIPVHLPPLRARREDIFPLADHFLSRACAEMGISARKLSAETEEILERHSWPGNVRELENAIGRAVALSEGEEITPPDLCIALEDAGEEVATPEEETFHESVRDHKRAIILRAIRKSRGSKTKAAEMLGLQPTYLSRLIRILKVEG